MSRWLSSVNNLLEHLDDQVENVRDVLTEQNASDDEYQSGSDEDGEESSEDEDQIDLIAAAEDGAALLKNAFFSAVPKAKTFSAPKADDEDVGEEEEYAEEETSPFDTPQPKPPRPPSPPQPPEEEETKAAAVAVPPQAEVTPVKDVSAKIDSESMLVPLPSKSPEGIAPAAPKPAPLKGIPQANPVASSEQGPTPTSKPIVNKQAQAKAGAGPPPIPKGSPQQQRKPQQKPPGKPPAPAQQQKLQPKPPPNKNASTAPNATANKTTRPPSSTGGASGAVNTNNKQQVLAEMRQLKKQVYNLQQELAAANKEIKAQQKELDSAATIVERERQDLKEEKEDMREDHEEEVASMRQEYDKTIVKLKANHKQELKDMRQQLSQEKAERQQEGGDLSQDLKDALERERGALQQVAALQTDKSALESRVQKLELQQDTLQENLEGALAAQETATQRQQTAEVALDDAQEQHKRQMKQRQVREAELEKTISDLGTALTATQQQDAHATIPATPAGPMSPMPPFPNYGKGINEADDFKKKCEEKNEEAETLREQLILESQRCQALRRELDEINQERTHETSTAQERQRYYDQKLEEQSVIIARLESTFPDQDGTPDTNGDPNSAVLAQKLQRQLEETKSQVSTLSEQLLRQQGNADTHKSEIFTLKERLQAANARAEEAEKTVFQAPTSTAGSANESEGGYSSGYKTRRRVKGGGRGRGGVTIRSIRTALNMGPGSGMEALGKTVEALDLWMIDTGHILRHEPLARLAFFVYFSILHLWCFCLVVFHTSSYETPHADFPRALRGAKGGVGMNVGGP